MHRSDLLLVYGRPFDAAHSDLIGAEATSILQAMALDHPDMVHAPLLDTGEWWIGAELKDFGPRRLPLNLGFAADGLLVNFAIEERVDSFLAALPEVIKQHPQLRVPGVYLVSGSHVPGA